MANRVLELIIKAIQQGNGITGVTSDLKEGKAAAAGFNSQTAAAGKTTGMFSGAMANASLIMTGLNQGLQLAQQGLSLLQKGYEETILTTVNYAEEVRVLSRTIGATPEEASKLIQAADDVKVSVSSLQTGLQIAIRNGLNPTIEGLGKMADEYNAIQNPIAKAKYLLDSFGRSGNNLAPLLEKGSVGISKLGDEAEALGLVLDADVIRATREYEIAVDTLNDTLEGLKVKIGTAVLPAITPLIEAMSLLTEGTGDFSAGAASFADFGDDVTVLNEAFKTGLIDVNEYRKNLLLLLTIPGLSVFAPGLWGSLQILKGEIEQLSKDVLPEGATITALYAAGYTVIADAMMEAASATDAAAIAAENMMIHEGEVTASYGLAKKAIQESNLSLEEKKRLLQEIALLTGETTQAELDHKVGLDILVQAYDEGNISLSEWKGMLAQAAEEGWSSEEMIRAIIAALSDLPYEKRVKIMVEQYGYRTGTFGVGPGGVQDEYGQAVGNDGGATGGGGENWVRLGKGYEVNTVTGYVREASWQKAHGGDVYEGQSYLVGEYGPEIVNMKSGYGTVIPNNQSVTPSGSGITIHFYGAGMIVREDADIEKIAVELYRRLH